MRGKLRVSASAVGAVFALTMSACSDPGKPASEVTGPVEPAATTTRLASSGKAGGLTLQELRNRNSRRWAGDSVQSVIRGYRADYVSRRKAKLPLKGICEGFFNYFTTKNEWGKSLRIRDSRQADLLNPKCGATTRKLRFFSTNRSPRSPEGESYVTERSMALLDSLQQMTDRVDAADGSASEAVAMLTSGIERIETLAANAGLTEHEYELVETAISGLAGTVAEAQSMVPAIIQDIASSVDECTQRLGYTPSDPAECDREVYEMFGPMLADLPRPVLMCAIALNMIATPQTKKNPCDGHQIIEGMAKGFIGGLVGGAWAGLVGTGGLGVPLTALLGGIGGATSGLAVGLAQSFWCEWTK